MQMECAWLVTEYIGQVFWLVATRQTRSNSSSFSSLFYSVSHTGTVAHQPYTRICAVLLSFEARELKQARVIGQSELRGR
jgi:hypothetical protein